MPGKQVRLFTMFGFTVRVHASWLIIALLVTWTLADGVFAAPSLGFSTLARWLMGAAGAIGLFASVIVHEMCHSLVARRYGLTMKGITLFVFGGVAELGEEPPSARVEFLMAVAGPAASVALGGLFLGLHLLTSLSPAIEATTIVLWWLGLINLVLAAFNLIPGFPLDGGRVLRSALWAWKGDLRWATRIAAEVGAFFGLALMGWGVLEALNPWGPDIVAGLWYFLIGLFIRYAARQGYQQVLSRDVLHGQPVRQVMTPGPVAVSPSLPLDQFVQQYVLGYHHKMFPVVEGGELLGVIDARAAMAVPREQWPLLTVGRLAQPCTPANTIGADEDALAAMNLMTKTGNGRLLVAEGPRDLPGARQLAGIVTLKDLVKFIALKMELDGRQHPAGTHLPHPR
ncbi:MAG: site-2 protease family protein [Phycisphaerae bacterium]